MLHDFQTATLVDKYVDTSKGKVNGIAKGRVTSKSLNSTVNLGNPASYAAAGAPANGADYVGLRDGQWALPGRLDSSEVAVASTERETLVPEPLKWTSVADRTRPRGDAALWSGNVVQPGRQCGHAGDCPGGEPDAHLQRAAPGREELRLRLHGDLDRRRQDLHGAGQREHGGRPVRSGAER